MPFLWNIKWNIKKPNIFAKVKFFTFYRPALSKMLRLRYWYITPANATTPGIKVLPPKTGIKG